MNKKSMSIDLDDTLSDFNNSWLSLYNEKSGDNLTVDGGGIGGTTGLYKVNEKKEVVLYTS